LCTRGLKQKHWIDLYLYMMAVYRQHTFQYNQLKKCMYHYITTLKASYLMDPGDCASW